MGVHESQSRIYENQMGRGRAFTGWLFERMGEVFGPLSTANGLKDVGEDSVIEMVEEGFPRVRVPTQEGPYPFCCESGGCHGQEGSSRPFSGYVDGQIL